MNPKDWLNNEDISCYEDRLSRLEWMSEKVLDEEYWFFQGETTKYLFEECRYCFVYGQFLASIILGLSFIEKTLSGLFFTVGRNDLKNESISKLFD